MNVQANHVVLAVDLSQLGGLASTLPWSKHPTVPIAGLRTFSPHASLSYSTNVTPPR